VYNRTTRRGVIQSSVSAVAAAVQERISFCLFVAVSQKGEGNVYARVKFRKNVWGGEAEQRGGNGNVSSREGKVDGKQAAWTNNSNNDKTCNDYNISDTLE